ncbi:MAG: NADH:flavin oxidoreductase [Polyangiaceae bacterium]|nr:NADH:flavin oxidoreductase [Polyangiaceae bacterium]
MTDPFSPFRLGGLTLRNRIVKTAAFEGMCPRGDVSDALIEHHRTIAAGGVGMTTVAYCAVEPDGRTFRDQLHMRREVVPDLRRLTAAVHAEGAAASIQLGHCGAFSNNADLGRRRPMGPSRALNLVGALSGRVLADPMTADEIAETTRRFAAAAQVAREAGFDAVEVHLGHGYLLSQFLSPQTNRRRDRYGGSLSNRARFALEVVERVREALPPEIPVLCKVNLRDGFRGGLELEESVKVARWLEARGADALILSGGFVSKNPFYLFRGERPLKEMIAVEKELPLKLALLLFGPFVIRSFPFEPLYFLPLAREVRRAVRMPLVLLGGIKSRADLALAMREGFELVAMGRALVHDPALVAKYATGEFDDSGCIPCNRCVAEMDREGGVCCPLVKAQVDARAARVLRARRSGEVAQLVRAATNGGERDTTSTGERPSP